MDSPGFQAALNALHPKEAHRIPPTEHPIGSGYTIANKLEFIIISSLFLSQFSPL